MTRTEVDDIINNIKNLHDVDPKQRQHLAGAIVELEAARALLPVLPPLPTPVVTPPPPPPALQPLPPRTGKGPRGL